MRNIKLIIEYDGSKYKGWQRQKKGTTTIQAKVEETLTKLLKEEIEIDGSGRTDSGVHAYGQIANFKTESTMDTSVMTDKLNNMLPNDISVKRVMEASKNFHARYDATGKEYVYKIDNSETPNVFMRKYALRIDQKLNVEAMNYASRYLIGEHDFKAFKASGGKKKSTVRRIDQIEFYEKNGLINIRIRGNGFLHHMVRIIVGTLVEVGLNNMKPEDVKIILESKDRENAGRTADARGLYLNFVQY